MHPAQIFKFIQISSDLRSFQHYVLILQKQIWDLTSNMSDFHLVQPFGLLFSLAH